MHRGRRWAPMAGGATFLLVLIAIAAGPAEAARLVKSSYRDLPAGITSALPDDVEARLGGVLDASARFLTFGDPDKLIHTDVRLLSTSSPAGTWLPTRHLDLVWTDLEDASIRYEVAWAPLGTPRSSAVIAVTASAPRATVEVDKDGSYTVWVTPLAAHRGRATQLGPFHIDATPPSAPILHPRADPPGYRFAVEWDETTDLSGILGYELERRLLSTPPGPWEPSATETGTSHIEDQVGNGLYEFRVRAQNGAGLPSAWSNTIEVLVKAPMQNPGLGTLQYGVHANFTGFLHAWDLTDAEAYLEVAAVPSDVRAAYLGPEPGIDVGNATLQARVHSVVGGETNTLRVAEALFKFLFDATDYDGAKPADPEAKLQSAGETLDRGKGICGDLAVLYITLLRIADVPARPVHGYLDNARSQVGGFHMWVEVYVGPVGSPHAWMTVDVSGVTGAFAPEWLFAYFGVYNPDYLSLGTERAYDRYADGQWNTWARFRYLTTHNAPRPVVADRAVVSEVESEYGHFYFNAATRATRYVACQNPDLSDLEDPCRGERAPAGFSNYYVMKGVSKKRLDYGANLEANMPSCLSVDLRYPTTDEYGAIGADQSSIYHIYEGTSSTQVRVGTPDSEGWITFLDGTDVASSCGRL